MISEGNTMNNRKGFTLVELVVVIAIIGVLAAILVPSLMGYVRKARLKQCNANAKIAYNVVSGMQIQMVTKGESYEELIDLEIDCRGTAPAPNTEATKEIYNSITTNGEGSGIMYIGEFENEDTGKMDTFVHWIARPDDYVVGQYPSPANYLDDVPEYKTYTP